ncbi:ABC transporter ATP-binding protein [Atopobacter sp. AH10]|uniref:ABC transporter ATP-binding protein n=1 Tax=Atopobacter sp. AH10 TaxID=2315861 RepID=UPI000EF26DB7|nr:ABC transporter ATP-binding protein [Atopobacter sp. AH10]RLK63464.1 ABC transporter ATP-binding protein [Atopobacter sp. AH10]
MKKKNKGPVIARISLKQFWNLVKSVRIPWVLLLVTIALSLINAKVSIWFPDYQRTYFEKGNLTSKTVTIGILILILSGLTSMISTGVENYLRKDIDRRFRNRIWQKSLALKVSSLRQFNPNELISRTTDDTQQLSDFMVTVTVTLLSAIYSVYINLALIASYHKNLMYVQLAVIPILLILRIIEGEVNYRIQYQAQYRLSKFTEYMAEILTNVPLIKSFVKEKYEGDRASKVIDDYNNIHFKSSAIGLLFIVGDNILQILVRVVGILYGGYLIKTGELDMASWIAYFGLSGGLYFTINQILQQWSILKGVQSAVARLVQIFELPEEDRKGQMPEDRVGDLNVHQAQLQLSGQVVLDDLSVTFAPKGKQVIVGPSGAGKSSLLNSLLRFHDLNEGSITLGGQDISTLDLLAYRQEFVYVPQEPVLFSRSLRDNLCYGLKEAVKDDEILALCHRLCLDELLDRLPDGLDSLLAESGQNLSGGERQKVAMVRAILQLQEGHKHFLLLDEITANLDPESEEKISQVIDELSHDYAVIIVTHRMHLAKDAKQIVVLKEGRLCGMGQHQDLLSTCPIYQQLVWNTGKED